MLTYGKDDIILDFAENVAGVNGAESPTWKSAEEPSMRIAGVIGLFDLNEHAMVDETSASTTPSTRTSPPCGHKADLPTAGSARHHILAELVV